jgi:hypothetical protein
VRAGWNKDVSFLFQDNIGITNGAVSSGDGSIYCSFTRDAAVTFPTPTEPSEVVTFDLSSTAYYQLGSTGQLDDNDLPSKHSNAFYSEDLIDYSA